MFLTQYLFIINLFIFMCVCVCLCICLYKYMCATEYNFVGNLLFLLPCGFQNSKACLEAFLAHTLKNWIILPALLFGNHVVYTKRIFMGSVDLCVSTQWEGAYIQEREKAFSTLNPFSMHWWHLNLGIFILRIYIKCIFISDRVMHSFNPKIDESETKGFWAEG